jgi:hypothetical protein
LDVFFKKVDAKMALILLLGKKQVAYRILARFRKLEIANGLKEIMGNIDKDARPVTGLAIGADGPAVFQFVKYFQSLMDDIVRFLPLQATDKSGATIIMFEFGQVKTLFL